MKYNGFCIIRKLKTTKVQGIIINFLTAISAGKLIKNHLNCVLLFNSIGNLNWINGPAVSFKPFYQESLQIFECKVAFLENFKQKLKTNGLK